MTPSDLFLPLKRTAILTALGLSKFSYYFFEAYDDQLLRALKVTAGQADTLLEPWTLTAEQADALSSAEYPVFLTRHAGYRLPIQTVDSTLTLLEQILPYPFAQMAVCAQTEDVGAFTVFPKGLLWSLRRFTAAFLEVERALATAEFGVLTIGNELAQAHLLTQQVGRKRALLTALHPGAIEKLDTIFANRYTHLNVTVEPQPNLISQLDHLVLALQGSIPAAPSAAPGAPSRPDLTL